MATLWQKSRGKVKADRIRQRIVFDYGKEVCRKQPETTRDGLLTGKFSHRYQLKMKTAGTTY